MRQKSFVGQTKILSQKSVLGKKSFSGKKSFLGKKKFFLGQNSFLGQKHPDPKLTNDWGPLSSTFHLEQPGTPIEWKFKSITYGRTDRQTWVGARDACASKKLNRTSTTHFSNETLYIVFWGHPVYISPIGVSKWRP